jgi:hypothetical protein
MVLISIDTVIRNDTIANSDNFIYSISMEEKLDKSQISFGSHDLIKERESKYWKNASYTEKITTITYLRECFYGPEATTGRLQRFYTFLKRK